MGVGEGSGERASCLFMREEVKKKERNGGRGLACAWTYMRVDNNEH